MTEAWPTNRKHPPVGVVHLGLGAFFRAHGALYLEDLMAKAGGDWGIVGVSLRHPDIRDRLMGQDFCYDALELGPHAAEPQLVRILNTVLVAPEDPSQVVAALADAKLVTLTVTEKGYCHFPATGRLNMEHPDILADLAAPSKPRSSIGFLVAGLRQKRTRGAAPFTVMSCDNLPGNGRMLKGLVLEFADRVDPSLARWIADNGAFPCSMVDRIVPATTADDLARIKKLTGLDDAAPVLHEPFRQWVIEDHFVEGTRPALDLAGVEWTSDVSPWEHMKLRCLNGTHSALAYLGGLAGLETVADAVAQTPFAAFLDRLWATEIVPTIKPPLSGQAPAYTNSLLRRYRNPMIRHRLAQIAMDGSQKLPQRILGTVADNLAAGRSIAGLCRVIAAWMIWTRGVDLQGRPIKVQDPLAERLATCWGAGVSETVDRYLKLTEVFPPSLAAQDAFRKSLHEVLESLLRDGVEASLRLQT